MAPDTLMKRQRTTKTRTGCLTCKIRRIKCGEERPSCLRCTSTGRKCDGYIQDSLVQSSGGLKVVPFHTCPTRIPGSSQEKRGFQFFVVETTSELSGFYSTDFWERFILQAVDADLVLRHAVIAIGALHRGFTEKNLSHHSTSASEDIHFAESQYAKAISLLRKSLASKGRSALTALMSCLLFVCFDSLRGFFESAMLHLRAGLKILRELKEQSREDQSIIEDYIKPLFMRLTVQATLYVDTRSTTIKRAFVADLEFISKPPRRALMAADHTSGTGDSAQLSRFDTLEEARSQLHRIADGLFRIFYICDPELPMQGQPGGFFDEYTAQAECFVDWAHAFENFMNVQSATMSGKQLRGAALLKIQQMVAHIMARSIPDPPDDRKLAEAINDMSQYSRFDPEFHTIVNLSKSLILAAEQDARRGTPKLTFSTDLGVIGPLYYVCQHAQDKELRMTALDLLKRSPRREGMWDGEATAQLVENYWNIQEEHNIMNSLQEDPKLRVPLSQVVSLDLDEGMKWRWKWKHPFTDTPSPSELASIEGPDPTTYFDNTTMGMLTPDSSIGSEWSNRDNSPGFPFYSGSNSTPQ